MSLPSSLRATARSIPLRPKHSLPRNRFLASVPSRNASDNAKEKRLHVAPDQKGPNTDQAPHVSEEQAAIDESMGQTPPDLDQGTLVKEVLRRDKDAQESAPQVIKDQLQDKSKSSPASTTGQKRSYSTSARRLAELASSEPSSLISEHGLINGVTYPDLGPGHKFPLVDVGKMSRMDHLKRRYDPIVDQLTKAIMRHGKLSQAQKNISAILTHLRTAPPPQAHTQFPSRTLLLTDVPPTSNSTYIASYNPKQSSVQPTSDFSIAAPMTARDPISSQIPISLPRSALPLHPIEYLTTAIDSVSPLIKIRQQRGAAGGGASLPIPVPLGIRQRRRQAIQWILTAADNRRETNLSERVAKEIIKVADGTSSVWEKRAMVHRLGVSARSNVRPGANRRRVSRR